MKNILIAGGSGLIGKCLSDYFTEMGYAVTWLSRKRDGNKYHSFYWNPGDYFCDAEAFHHVDVLIQLAGDNIGSGWWTEKKKNKILQSRIRAIQTIHKQLKKYNLRIPHILQASAIGYYGSRTDEILTEYSKGSSRGFLSQVVNTWEAEAGVLKEHCECLTILRTGLYLNPAGGVWPELTQTKRFGFLVVPGEGKQYYSWIHYQDYNRAIAMIISGKIAGTVNLTAPNPLTAQDFMNCIAKVSGQKMFIVKVPAFLFRYLLGEKAQLLLDSARVIPEGLLKQNFTFKYPQLSEAILNLYGRREK